MDGKRPKFDFWLIAVNLKVPLSLLDLIEKFYNTYFCATENRSLSVLIPFKILINFIEYIFFNINNFIWNLSNDLFIKKHLI